MSYIYLLFGNYIFALILTYILIKIAHRFKLYDKPDNKLKLQKKPVPCTGGSGFVIPFLFFLLILNKIIAYNAEQSLFIKIILTAGIYIFILGIIDDILRLGSYVKLIFQIIIIIFIVKSGIKMNLIIFPDWLNSILSILWLIGVINAVNIIDIIDGLAGGVSVIIAVTFGFLGLISGNIFLAVCSILLSVSILGFLCFNYKNARVYMGDSGSLFLGMVFGILSLEMSYTRVNDVGFLIPLIIMGIPIYDTFFVIIMRYISGKPILKGSRDHIALRILDTGLSINRTVKLFYLFQIGLGILALSIMQVNRWTAIGIYIFILTISIYIGNIFSKINIK